MRTFLNQILRAVLTIVTWIVVFPCGLLIIGYENGWIVLLWFSTSGYFSLRFASKVTKPKTNNPVITLAEVEDFRQKLSQNKDKRQNVVQLEAAVAAHNTTIEPVATSDEFVPDEDAYEWPKGEPVTYYKIKISLTFSYIDNGQQRSRRTVDFFEQLVFRPERKFLVGICRVRQEERIFSMRKMSDISDAETGEVVDDVYRYVKETWKNSPGIALGNWFDKHSNYVVLKGISHTLRMHGNPSEKEYEVVIKMASTLLGRDDIDAEAIDMACQIVFPNRMLSGLMQTIVKNVPDSWYLFSETVSDIIEARGSSKPEDQQILNDLKKFENRLITSMAVERHNWLVGNGLNNSN